MVIESNCCNRQCIQGLCRRDFVRFLVLTGLFAGCSTDQKPTAGSIGNPSGTPASEISVPSTSASASKPSDIPAYSPEDFSRMAFCGIRCQSSCPEHEYPEGCGGCKSNSEKLGSYCRTCPIRECAGKRQGLTCAHCDEYPSCEVDTWTRFPILREKIDNIRRYLETQS